MRQRQFPALAMAGLMAMALLASGQTSLFPIIHAQERAPDFENSKEFSEQLTSQGYYVRRESDNNPSLRVSKGDTVFWLYPALGWSFETGYFLSASYSTTSKAETDAAGFFEQLNEANQVVAFQGKFTYSKSKQLVYANCWYQGEFEAKRFQEVLKLYQALLVGADELKKLGYCD